MKTFAVILAGGKGERFWPASRRNYPKQFLKMFGKQSLIQMTSRRIARVCPLPLQRFVIDRNLGKVLRRQLKLTSRNFIFEPYGRNTAPAIALAAEYIEQEAGDSVMVVLPADHLIHNTTAFQRSVRFAARVAEQGYLVTFGIPPARPDTGYGYIEVGAELEASGINEAFKVKRFREKPDLKQARQFLKAGNFWWNSGMFVWTTKAFLQNVRAFMPRFFADLKLFGRRIGTAGEQAALDKLYAKAPSVSVDYAIMEKSRKVAVVRADFDWDDVGAWPALERHFVPDKDGNVQVGRAVALDSKGCLGMGQDGLVAMLGCEDLIVVRTKDAVLVLPKSRAGDIKKLLAQLAADPHYQKYL